MTIHERGGRQRTQMLATGGPGLVPVLWFLVVITSLNCFLTVWQDEQCAPCEEISQVEVHPADRETPREGVAQVSLP